MNVNSYTLHVTDSFSICYNMYLTKIINILHHITSEVHFSATTKYLSIQNYIKIEKFEFSWFSYTAIYSNKTNLGKIENHCRITW